MWKNILNFKIKIVFKNYKIVVYTTCFTLAIVKS